MIRCRSIAGLVVIGLALIPSHSTAQLSTLSRGGITKESSWQRFPVATTAEEADSLFGASGFEAVSSVGLAFSGGDGAFYSEFLTDNLAVAMRLGYGRIGFGAFVQSKSQDESTPPGDDQIVAETAAERFLAAGGNAMMYYAVPLFVYGAGFNESDEKTIGLQFMLFPRVGFDVPALSAGRSDFNGNLDIGATVSAQLLSDEKVFNVFGSVRAGWVPLASDQFFKNLNREDAFAYASGEAGVVLRDFVRISVRAPLSGPSALMRRAPATISIQLIPLRDER